MLQVISAVVDTVRKAEKKKCWEGSVTVEREEKMGDDSWTSKKHSQKDAIRG